MEQSREQRLAAAKAFIEQLLAGTDEELTLKLQGICDALNTAVQGLDEAVLDFEPETNRWSISRVVTHVAHSTRGCAAALQGLARGHVPPHFGEEKIGVVGDDLGGVDAALAANMKGFASLIKLAGKLDAVDPSVTWAHPWFGPMNVRAWLAFVVLHTHIHVEQIEGNKAAWDAQA
jgi:hypothetical protein